MTGIVINLLTDRGVDAYRRDRKDRLSQPKKVRVAYRMMYDEEWVDTTVTIRLRKPMESVNKVTGEYDLLAKLVASVITALNENGAQLDTDFTIEETS